MKPKDYPESKDPRPVGKTPWYAKHAFNLFGNENIPVNYLVVAGLVGMLLFVVIV